MRAETIDAYAAAGVDIGAGNRAVERIADHVERTRRPEVLDGVGGFGASFALDTTRYRQPVLVSATDGVGTKLVVAQTARRLDTVGVDLVAMCVNDLITTGAEPLFFLDYIATGVLDVDQVEQIVRGIADGCLAAGCALVGGETAELPGMYEPGAFDLAGFAVGVVERAERLERGIATPGDALVGIASSGLHSNGFSLARQVLDLDDPAALAGSCDWAHDRSLADVVLEPTRIYVRAVRALVEEVEVRGLAHVTGGGLVENVPRVLDPVHGATIDPASWSPAAVFAEIVERAALDADSAYRVFNMGIGMVVVVPRAQVDRTIRALNDAGEVAHHIGVVTRTPGVELAAGSWEVR